MKSNSVGQKAKDIIKFTFKQYTFKDKFAFVIYVVMSFLGKLLFFTKPIFEIADDNIARMIVETHYINLPKIFEGVSKKYGKLLIASTIQFFESFSFMFLFFVVPLIAFIIIDPYIFSNFYFDTILLIIGFVVSIIISIILSVKYWPVTHILLRNSTLSMSDALLIAKLNKKSYVKKIIGARLPFYIVTFLYFALEVTLIICGANKVLYNELGDGTFYIIYPIVIILVNLLWLWISRLYIKKNVVSYIVYKDALHVSKPIVVKQVCGEKLDYEPLFKDEEIDFNVVNKKEAK